MGNFLLLNFLLLARTTKLKNVRIWQGWSATIITQLSKTPIIIIIDLEQHTTIGAAESQ